MLSDDIVQPHSRTETSSSDRADPDGARAQLDRAHGVITLLLAKAFGSAFQAYVPSKMANGLFACYAARKKTIRSGRYFVDFACPQVFC